MQTIKLAHLHPLPEHKVLDLGCGEGRHCHAVYHEAKCHVIGLDLGFADVRKTRDGFAAAPVLAPAETQRFHVLVGNALSLPFPDHSMDRVICSEVLEHIPDYLRVIEEIDRVVKPDGVIGISVPRRWPEKICWWLSADYHNEPGGHIRIFNQKELTEDFRSRGFRLIRKDYAHGLHTPYWWLRCAFGVKKPLNPLTRAWHSLLVLEMMKNPLWLRGLSRLLDICIGKSVVLYFEKPAGAE
ncbi:MAG: class I SAM-dependent methyltransferase [Parvibaculales bacterium]